MYISILKSLSRSPWRWPLIPFAAVALFCVFGAVCVFDAAVGIVFLFALVGAMLLAVITELFDPTFHQHLRAQAAGWAAKWAAWIGGHPVSLKTWRNPRWWVALPLWSVTLPFIVMWSLLESTCERIADGLRKANDKLSELTDFAMWRHMRKLWCWVFEGKA